MDAARGRHCHWTCGRRCRPVSSRCAPDHRGASRLRGARQSKGHSDQRLHRSNTGRDRRRLQSNDAGEAPARAARDDRRGAARAARALPRFAGDHDRSARCDGGGSERPGRRTASRDRADRRGAAYLLRPAPREVHDRRHHDAARSGDALRHLRGRRSEFAPGGERRGRGRLSTALRRGDRLRHGAFRVRRLRTRVGRRRARFRRQDPPRREALSGRDGAQCRADLGPGRHRRRRARARHAAAAAASPRTVLGGARPGVLRLPRGAEAARERGEFEDPALSGADPPRTRAVRVRTVMGGRGALALLLGLAGWVACAARPLSVHAAEAGVSYSTWIVSGDTVMLRFVLPAAEANRLAGSAIPVLTVSKLGDYLLEHTAVTASGRDCPAIDQGYDLGRVAPVRVGAELYGFEIVFRCSAPIRSLVLENRALFDRVPGHVDFARIEAGRRFTDQLFTAGRQRVRIPNISDAPAASLGAYVRLGIGHVLRDAGRLCFLTVALLVVMHRPRRILLIIAGLVGGYAVALAADAGGLVVSNRALIEAFIGCLIA